jgi:hypothetical protein
MKSTMQYLVLGLALAGVPLLAEADEGGAIGLTSQIGHLADAHSLLSEQDELRLVTVEQKGEQAYLRLQARNGEQLLVRTLAGNPVPMNLQAGARIQIDHEIRGWSFSHDEELLAFIPNQHGRALLLDQGV